MEKSHQQERDDYRNVIEMKLQKNFYVKCGKLYSVDSSVLKHSIICGKKHLHLFEVHLGEEIQKRTHQKVSIYIFIINLLKKSILKANEF